jgi:putative inorganic carbon (HCO3(-)) transporter
MSNYNYIIGPVREWFRYHFFERKLDSIVGIAVLFLLAVIVGYASAFIDYRAGFGVVAIFIAIFLIVLFMRYPYFGLYFLIAYAALPAYLARILLDTSIKPDFGLIFNILLSILLFSVITKSEFQRRNIKGFWGNAITTSYLILFLFYIIEALNPNMMSTLGWFSYIKGYLSLMLFFYIVFCLLNSWAAVKKFIYFNIALTTVLAIYSCKQQWFGLTAFEWRWATSNPTGYIMLLQGGLLRKWSTLSDPATAGILFSSVAVQCIILFLREPKRKAKIFYAIAICFNLLAYGYSGTRTATLMLLSGIAFYIISTIYEKRTVIFMAAAIGIFALMMVSPYSPPPITRIKTTFEGSKDASAAIRDYDRHQVQPYLYQHPMGGGIFTCGMEGPKYSKGHYLEDFQPDSGYMKVFAEQGWIGLAILLLTYFLILSHSLHNFYRVTNPQIQNHSIALIAMVFTLMVGQFSQFALGPLPQVYSFFGALVIFIKMRDFDHKEKNH